MTSPLKFKLSAFILAVIFASCNHYDSIKSSGRESVAGGKSHNAGKDCMSCHHDNSSSASSSGTWWYFAGTAYNSNGSIATSGSVELWSDSLAKGTLIYSVPIDRGGNFYTAKIFNFGKGVYPKLVSNSNTSYDTIMKPQMVTFNSASCNSCHGNNSDLKNQPHITFK